MGTFEKREKKSRLKDPAGETCGHKKPPGRKRDNKQKETLPNKIGCARINGMM